MNRSDSMISQQIRPLRVLYLTYYFFPHVGGATWTAYNICSTLKKKGHKIMLLAPYIVGLSISRKNIEPLDDPFFSIDRYPIPRLIAPFLASFRNSWRGMVVLRRERFDVIMVQYHPHHLNFPFALLLARIFRLPIVVRADDVYREMGTSESLHKRTIVQVLNTLNEKLISHSDLFLVVTSEVRRSLHLRRPEIPLSLLQLSPNGFVPPSSNQELRQKNDGENKNIVFVGRFSGAEYGVELLLNAVKIVVETVQGAKLVLVGDELSESMKRQIREMGLDKSVTVYPPTDQSNISRIIDESSVCVGPLFPTQTIPLKVLEYMALGQPVVSGVYSISSDLAINAENCLLVNSNPKDIANAIVEFFYNRELARRIGRNALLSVEKFSWEHVVEDMVDKLHMVVIAHTQSCKI